MYITIVSIVIVGSLFKDYTQYSSYSNKFCTYLYHHIGCVRQVYTLQSSLLETQRG